MQLGVGFLGFGFMGRMQAFCHRAIPWYYDPPPLETRLVAVATSREETARQAASHGFDFATDDWREVIARDDVQIVHVCTPNDMHADQAVAALEAGKHVYCDKPLARTLEEAARIVEAGREAPGCFQLACQYRYLPAIMRARQLVDEGFLGRPFAFRAVYLHSGYVDPARPMSWRLDKARAGAGALGDLGSHVIDLLMHLLGPFAAVNATFETFIKERPKCAHCGPSAAFAKTGGGTAPVEVDDAAYLLLRTRSGALGTVEVNRLATGANDDLRFEMHGDGGALRFSLMDPNWLEAYDNTLPGKPLGGRKGFARIECVQRYENARLPGPKFTIGWERAHLEGLAAFLRAVASGSGTHPSLEEAYGVQRVMDAAGRSASSGGWVEMGE